MHADYDSQPTVRHMRWLGWTLFGLIMLGLVWVMTDKVLRVIEARTVSATRENISASLVALSAERVAQGLSAEPSGLGQNPFKLLRWQNNDYCGELLAAQLPEPSCWYYLPQRSWLLHRSRFADEKGDLVAELQVFQLQAVPKQGLNRTESQDAVSSLELTQVATTEVALWVDNYKK
jgi:hypothetical protein